MERKKYNLVSIEAKCTISITKLCDTIQALKTLSRLKFIKISFQSLRSKPK